MSQNPQIFIRNEIFNSRVARQGIRVVGKIVELNQLKLERSVLIWKESFEVGKFELILKRTRL